jgi:hypothetical protein
MNRKIEFRGKSVRTGKWVYGDLQATGYNNFSIVWYPSLEKVIPETVGQFTGAFDVLRNEIYEGDVFHHGDERILYVVEFHDCGFVGRQIGSKSMIGLSNWIGGITKVGNIHDNKKEIK